MNSLYNRFCLVFVEVVVLLTLSCALADVIGELERTKVKNHRKRRARKRRKMKEENRMLKARKRRKNDERKNDAESIILPHSSKQNWLQIVGPLTAKCQKGNLQVLWVIRNLIKIHGQKRRNGWICAKGVVDMKWVKKTSCYELCICEAS